MVATKIEMENCNKELMHLGFVRTIVIKIMALLLILYEYAKQNCGPLKSTVGTVERAVTTVVRPVCYKFDALPAHVLVFLDNKVDKATKKFDEKAPTLAKKVVSQVLAMVYKISQLAENMVQQGQMGGPNAAIAYASSVYKQSVLIQLAKTWYGINQIPLLHLVANLALPTAVYISHKYNQSVHNMISNGYIAFRHLPLLPLDDMARAYKQVEAANKADMVD